MQSHYECWSADDFPQGIGRTTLGIEHVPFVVGGDSRASILQMPLNNRVMEEDQDMVAHALGDDAEGQQAALSWDLVKARHLVVSSMIYHVWMARSSSMFEGVMIDVW